MNKVLEYFKNNYSEEIIAEEIENIKRVAPHINKKIEIRTFGNFSVLVNDSEAGYYGVTAISNGNSSARVVGEFKADATELGIVEFAEHDQEKDGVNSKYKSWGIL